MIDNVLQLTKSAQQWADKMASTGKLDISCKSNTCAYGENQSMRPPNTNMTAEIKTAVKSWYDQKANYDFATGKAKAGKPDGSFLAFTALVWKQSTKVGIGATRKSDGYIYIVVQFGPAGNMGGAFLKNVLQ